MNIEELGNYIDAMSARNEMLQTIDSILASDRNIPEQESSNMVFISGNKHINKMISLDPEFFAQLIAESHDVLGSSPEDSISDKFVVNVDNMNINHSGIKFSVQDTETNRNYRVYVGSQFSHPAYSGIQAHRDI